MSKAKMDVVIVRMEPEMYTELKSLAAMNDRTMAAEVRRAVRFWLADEAKPKER